MIKTGFVLLCIFGKHENQMLIIMDRSLRTGTIWDAYFQENNRGKDGINGVIKDLRRKKMQISCSHICIMLGNRELPTFTDPVRDTKNIILQIQRKHPRSRFYVAGILPRVDQEALLTPTIMDLNKSFAGMCHILSKWEKIDVQFVSLYKLFLERAKFAAPYTKEIQFHTQVVKPPSTYFLEDGQELNMQARLKAVKYLLTVSGIKPDTYKWAGIPLVVEQQVQKQEDVLSILQSRGRDEFEWAEEDEEGEIVEMRSMMVLDEVGATTEEEADSEKEEIQNLEVTVKWEGYLEALEVRERKIQEWAHRVADGVDFVPSGQKHKKRRGGDVVILAEETDDEEKGGTIRVVESSQKSSLMSMDMVLESVVSESSEEVMKRVVGPPQGGELLRIPESSESEEDDLGEDTVVQVPFE